MNSIQKVLKKCNHQIPTCHQKRVIHLHQKLCDGTPFAALGGKRLHQKPYIIRFKIGRAWRLLYSFHENRLEPKKLISRQCLESEIKRVTNM